MKFIADFHIHSKYSRATSSRCVPEKLDLGARLKGIDLQGTGDFTHAAWRAELDEKLTPGKNGLYVLKDKFREKCIVPGREVKFIITGEISSIYKKNGKTRKVHNVIVLPDLKSAEKLSKRLEVIGNLHSDGRPILGLDSKNLLDITLNACPEALFIPAHIWTPHFSVFGANSGFDDIEECFEDLTPHIYALETGLSSDPPMNWRLSALDRFALVSNSDAHSPANLAREANIFDTDLTYDAIYKAFKTNDHEAFTGTIEFFPEEGKYHFDGHRACKVQWEPSQTIAASGICPVCGGKLTIGVLNRVEQLADPDRDEHFVLPGARGFERIVPLAQIISSCIGSPSNSNRVNELYTHILEKLGPELSILREVSIDDIKTAAGELIAEGIRRVREGKLNISAGYDGEYGVVEIFSEQQRNVFAGQTDLFGAIATDITIKKKSVSPKVIVKKKTENPEKSRQGLNEQQLEAISSTDKAIMVIAGPGTGKTHTLASRMAYLVTQSGISPCSMTAVTFTNKAASEMQKRLSGLLKNSSPADMPHIGTFHNICLDLLRIISPQKSFTIIDQASATAIIKDIIGNANIKASDAMRKISLAKASGRAGIAAIDPQIQSIYSEYTNRLEQFDAMDFDDILLKTSQALENNQLYEKISGRFQYILVDEFQDINNIQYSLVKLWAKAHGNIFVIGDPHQAIYGFRGASPAYFKTFGHDFPNVKIITLTRNYRSPGAVVNAAASVISHSADAKHYPLSMRVESKNKKPVRFVETHNEFFEALFIAKEINRMAGGIDMLDTQSFLDGRPAGKMGTYGFSDMAVLYRTHKQADIIEQCLLKEGIPYRVAGREDFLNDDVVRHAMAFFKFIINPDDISSLSLCFNKCLKNDSLEIVRRYGAGLHNIETLESIANCRMLPSDDSPALVSFINTVKKFSRNLYSQNPQTLVCSWAEEYKAAQHPGILRLSAISELYPDIKSLIFNITMGQDADIVRNGLKTPVPDAVLLTTLHAAKGLEFPVVFLCGVNEGVIPLHNSFAKETDIEEERRLFYVGITRAKDELVCTMSRKRTIMGSATISSQSCFVKEMDEKKLLKEKFGLEQNVKQMSFL